MDKWEKWGNRVSASFAVPALMKDITAKKIHLSAQVNGLRRRVHNFSDFTRWAMTLGFKPPHGLNLTASGSLTSVQEYMAPLNPVTTAELVERMNELESETCTGQSNADPQPLTGVSPAGSETGSPFGGAYRVIDDPLAWFVLPVGYSQKDLYKFAQVVYEEGAPMREALGETAGEGETDFGGFGFLEVVSRSSVGGFPGAPIRGVDGRLLRVAHGRARALVGLIGSGGRENVEVVRQCVLQLEQHTPGGLITGVCVQNVPRDISTPFKDLRWNPIGFFSLREIASDASAGVISILITNIPNSASEKQLKETLTHAEVPFVGNISLPRGKRQDRNLGRATV